MKRITINNGTMSYANHLAKETLFAIMLYSVMVAHKNLTLVTLVRIQLGQFTIY